MKKTKSKYYVVWEGHHAGIFDAWDKCKKQVDGYTGAKYKSFDSLEEAKKAFGSNAWNYLGKTVRRRLAKNCFLNTAIRLKKLYVWMPHVAVIPEYSSTVA